MNFQIWRFFTICCVFFSLQISSEVLTYDVVNFSPRAHQLMKDLGSNALYKVDLMYVRDYLPYKLTIHPLYKKLVSKRLFPGKSFVNYRRHHMLKDAAFSNHEDPKSFFASFREGIPHTYVILEDMLIFTESTSIPQKEKYKDRFSKHFFISGLKKHVHYSGEFFIYKNKENQEVFIVFDNKSGTYRPPEALLQKLNDLLNRNFTRPGLYFSVKTREQRVDRKRLFKHKTSFVYERRCLHF